MALDPGQSIEVDGQVVTGTHRFGSLAERSGVDVVWHDGDESVVIEVARRGGSDIVRPRRPSAPLRVSYRGTPAYAPDPAFAVEARFEPFDEPREVTVGSVVDGLQHVYTAPGVLRFELDGPRALTAFNGYGDGLLVLFTDRTSGVTTYAATRSLDVPARTPPAARRSTSTGRRTCRAPTPRTRRARCLPRRTGSTWPSRPGSACPPDAGRGGADSVRHRRCRTTSA